MFEENPSPKNMAVFFNLCIHLACWIVCYCTLYPCSILKEVTVLLEALEKRQLELESENKQLKEDLAEATNMIEKANAANKLLNKRLAEKDVQLSEKKCIVFSEHLKTRGIPAPGPTADTILYSSYPPAPSIYGDLAATSEIPPLPVEKGHLILSSDEST